MNQKYKFDKAKPMWDLVDLEVIEDVAEVLTYGAEKYAPHSWVNVEKDRYFAAMMRHITAYQNGEELDKESGLTHLAHAMCNLMFISRMEKNGKTSCKNSTGNKTVSYEVTV